MTYFRKPKNIDDDPRLKKFLDEAGPDGIIYVSFGSALRASVMSDDKKNDVDRVWKVEAKSTLEVGNRANG